MKTFETKKELKQLLAGTKEHIEHFEIFDPKTINRTMKILEADAWCTYWTQKRDELLLSENHLEKPNLEA